MSASQPLSLYSNVGKLTSSSASAVTTNPHIVRTGVVLATASTTKGGGSIGICNTTTDAGIGSIFVNQQDSILYRYGHPAQSTITGITTGTSTVLTLDHPDTKLRVGDRIQVIGSSVAAYNNALSHKEITAISSPQQWNDYTMTLTVDANTSGIVTAFAGIATAARSVVFVMAPEGSSGCDMFIQEVQLA
jgi:hypothetical protein